MSASSSGRIARSTGILALSTGASRILGFIRDILLARLFGATAAAQAFVVAFRLPNLLRDLVAEGAVTSAVVPVLSGYRAKGDAAQFWRLSHALLARLLLPLCVIGFAGVLAAPGIVRLIAPGFAGDAEKLALTVQLTRILFPFITLVGLWAFFMGLLNSLGHFALPALGPAILNVAMILACLWFVPRTEPGVLALAVGVMVGGVVQLLVQVPAAVQLGFRWRWRWAHPGADEVMRLLGPRTLGAAVYQVSVLFHTALASLGTVVGDGAVAALYFANRLVQLPLALFGTASAQASLPSLSEQAARHDVAAFRSTLSMVIRMVGFVILPSTVGLMVLAFPIVQVLFERGAFDRQATVLTTQALSYYALGLFAYSLAKVLTGAFYALRDTATPVKLAAEAVAVNIVLSLLLMWPMGIRGLALAAAISNTVNALRLLQRMEQRLGTSLLRPAGGALLRVLAASVLMGIGCRLLSPILIGDAPTWYALLFVIVGGVALYSLACALLRVQEFGKVVRWVGKLPFLAPSASE